MALLVLAFFSIDNISLQAHAASGKKHKRRHKASHVNMSLVPPPPPSVAIPAGMLLSVPPPPTMAMLPVQFNQFAYQPQSQFSAPHRCAHCGFSDSNFLSPSVNTNSSYFKPFPRRTFYNTDSYTTVRKTRARKTQSEKQTRRFKRRKCIYAAQ